MEQFKQFSVEKQAVIGKLQELSEILNELQGMGVEVEADLAKVGITAPTPSSAASP